MPRTTYQALHKIFFFFIVLMFCSCSASSTPPLSNSGGTTTTAATSVPTPMPTATPIPAVQTSCPADGTARVAVMPPLTLGTHQNLVYAWNQYINGGQYPITVAGVLRRYDTTTGKKSDIVTLPKTSIDFAQVSADGQWILFESHNTNQTVYGGVIQMVRLDGQYLQTLYCSKDNTHSLSQVSWSPDQQIIAFSLSAPEEYNHSLSTLNLRSGMVQTTVTGFLSMKTWLDNSHLVVATTTIQQGDQPTLYFLDITKHDQHTQDLQMIRKEQTSCYSVSNSSNPNVLYVSECDSSHSNGSSGPSIIRSVPVSGNLPDGWPAQIVVDDARAIFTVSPLNQQSVLYITTDGLWKGNTDGSRNTKHLITTNSQSVALNAFSTSSWSNVSRDEALYAVHIQNNTTQSQSLSIGSVNGGSASAFAQASNVDQLMVVGWTTL